MIGIDTNVLTRAFVNEPHALQPAARRLLSSLTPDEQGFITQVTLAELYWVLKSGYGYDKRSRLAVIRALVESPVLEFDDGEAVVRGLTVAEDGADFPDGLIQGTMELFGVPETVTFDRDASRRLGWTLLEA